MSYTRILAILRQVLHSFYTSHLLANNSAVEYKTGYLRGNPKLKALNPKQILISKFKVQNRFGHSDFGHLVLFSISDLVFRVLFSRDCHAALAMTGKKGWQ